MKFDRPQWTLACLVLAAGLPGCGASTNQYGGPSPSPPQQGTPSPSPTRTPQMPGQTPSPIPTPSARPTIGVTTLPAGPKIYVANHGKGASNPSVTIYGTLESGNEAPLATLAGSNTTMEQIQFPAVDASGNLYLSDTGTAGNTTSGYIGFFGATGQSGNQPPSYSIANLASPEGIAIDASGDIYVAAFNEILVYPPNPTAATAPIRTITGSFSGSNEAYGLAIDSDNRLYVTLTDEVLVFAAGASGNATPVQQFDDDAAGLDSCLGIAVDTSDNIYCANFNNSTITEYSAGSTGGVVTPLVTATDPTLTSIDEPFGIFIDASNTIYVANYGNDSVSVFASGSLATGTATRRIDGAATGLNSPYGIYVR